MPTPAADLGIDAELVHGLLAEQHPDLAHLPLRLVASGWDNCIFRLGNALALRIPRRESAAHLVRHEQLALPVLPSRLPLSVPLPVRVGVPSARFGWHWSIVPWFQGRTVADSTMRADGAAAAGLAAFVTALHVPAPEDAPVNPVRGVALARRDAVMGERFSSGAVARSAEVRAVWRAALAAPRWSGPALWLHGDLHPANLLARAGRLTAVIDFGDVTAGDPATDLATAWLTFDASARTVFRAGAGAGIGVDDATWLRARGWAACIGAAMVVTTEPGSLSHRIGTAALEQVLLPE